MRSWVRTPFKPEFFFQAFFSQLVKLRTNCEDLSSIDLNSTGNFFQEKFKFSIPVKTFPSEFSIQIRSINFPFSVSFCPLEWEEGGGEFKSHFPAQLFLKS